MSRVLKELSSIDAMPSNVETPNRVIGRTVGTKTFRSRVLSPERNGLNLKLGRNNYLENLTDQSMKSSVPHSTTLGMHSRLNEDFNMDNLVNKSVTSRAFGLQGRNHVGSSSEIVSHSQNNLNMNQEVSDVNRLVRTFGLMSDNLGGGINPGRNEPQKSGLRRSDSVNSSQFIRPFGLQSKNTTLHSRFLSENDLRGTQNSEVVNSVGTRFGSMISRRFGLGSERAVGGMSVPDNEGYIQDLRRNNSVSSSLIGRPFGQQFGQQSKNLTMHSAFLTESNSGLNQDSRYRNSSVTTTFQMFRPESRSNICGAESQINNSAKLNNEMFDEGGFRRPMFSRVIKGRNSVMSSRLFGNQNMEKHCRDLSNINGFNVSHISRRDIDTMSESRLGFNMRGNGMDNLSIVGSTYSGASMKAQFVNLLENLHHSILSIGPHMTAEAIRMEFDKAKQGLDNISEMSFAHSVRDLDAASVISQSSKYNCLTINETKTRNVIDGGSLHLKSSKEILKTLVSNKTKQKNNFNSESGTEEGRREEITSRESSERDSDDEEVAQFLFKKPKPFTKRIKSLRNAKNKTVDNTKKKEKVSENEITKEAINLKQWYPVAFESDLAFCGVNEKGVSVKTDPVKKRLNGRKVELINGLFCNLIGSPSATVSVLPTKITNSLKNGLTDRWRVLQKELLSCQTAEEEHKKRTQKRPKSASPRKSASISPAKKITNSRVKIKKVVSSPKKIKINNSTPKKRKSETPKSGVSPKKNKNVSEVSTRSGRTVKPPTMFWLVLSKGEDDSLGETKVTKVSSKNKTEKISNETFEKTREKASIGSPKKQETKEKSETKKLKKSNTLSPEKGKKADDSVYKTPRGRPPKLKTLKERQLQEIKMIVTKDAKQQNKTVETRGRRKRKITGENESIQRKKSKFEKKTETELESTAEESEAVTKKEKKKNGKVTVSVRSPKSKGKKSPVKKNKKEGANESKSDKKKDGNDLVEFEEDFELQLDDIEIPEIANISGNPKLSRSQMRVVSMETPPLKYFNSNLKLLRNSTPMRSPDWCISQRTESEVKRFQKRREEAFKKKTRVDVKKTIVTEKTTKTVQNKDLKRVMEWVSEKAVNSPVWKSKVLQYVIPSRRQREQEDDEAEEDEYLENEFS